MIAEEIEALSILPTNVLSGCFSNDNDANTSLTVRTARHSFLQVAAYPSDFRCGSTAAVCGTLNKRPLLGVKQTKSGPKRTSPVEGRLSCRIAMLVDQELGATVWLVFVI